MTKLKTAALELGCFIAAAVAVNAILGAIIAFVMKLTQHTP